MNQTGTKDKGQSTSHTTIPTVRTSFVGRQREVREVTQLLASSQLVTLTGAAGCGKTRLALRVAREKVDRDTADRQYPDGAHWVELARLAEPALVPQAVAKGLRIGEQRDRSSLETVLDALRNRRLLLVLDNCEHLLAACARLVAALLAETDVTVLATSREPLGVAGETRYPVTPLSLPPATLPAGAVDELDRFDAIQLFVERARAIVPAFRLTAGNAVAVADICRTLDGIPLALELASARLNVLTAGQIAARLDDQFELLPPTTPVTYSHHDTLRAAIEWSYDLLSEPEQTLLRRLSVFAGGCSLGTAEAVCAGDGGEQDQMLDLISSLVSKSLVVAETLQRGKARYSLLEPVRQYAHEKLGAAGEGPLLRDRHLRRFLHLTEEAAPELRGEHQRLRLNWLEEEVDNVRAALSWSLESNQAEAGLRIAVAVHPFWTVRDYMEEGAAWLERLLKQTDEKVSEGVPAKVRANVLAYAAFLAEFRGNSEAQMAYGEEAAALAEELGDGEKEALAWALQAQAFGARAGGDEEAGFALYRQVVQLHRESGDRYRLGEALTTCGIAAMSLGNHEESRAMVDEALPLVRETGEPYGVAMLLNFSGDLARCEQDYARAKNAYEECISLLRDLHAPRQLASALHNLGHTCLQLGDVERARALFKESLALQQAQQNEPGMAECLIGFAALAVFEGLPAAGARLLAAAGNIGGERVVTAWEATRLAYEGVLEQARAGLSPEAFQAEQAAGRALSLEQAVVAVQEVADEAAASQRARAKLDELTPREREVAALIARARSNAEIAEELIISKRTVEKHVSNIRSKLAFTRRAQIVRWALESGLVNQADATLPQ